MSPSAAAGSVPAITVDSAAVCAAPLRSVQATLIAAVAISNSGSDMGQMSPMHRDIQQRYATTPDHWLADGGFTKLQAIDELTARGAKPLARLVAYAHAGVDPKYMGIGPVPATQAALKKAGLTVKDLDVIEANEAFAAQACAVTRDLGLDPAKVNPNGSGISLGHPIGATGALITVKALYELQRINGRYALVTMCIGGGQGIAAVFERV